MLKNNNWLIYSSIRTVLYKTIEVWIQSLGASCGMDMCTSDICYYLLQDVTPQVDTVKVRSADEQFHSNFIPAANVGIQMLSILSW